VHIYINYLSAAPLDDFTSEATPSGLSSVAVAFIVIGCLAGVAVIGGIAFYVYTQKKGNSIYFQPLVDSGKNEWSANAQ